MRETHITQKNIKKDTTVHTASRLRTWTP